jgi:hypothetical protein
MVISALVIGLGACGLGDKQEQADAIIDSVDAAFDAGSARGTVTASMRFARMPEGAEVQLGALNGDAAMGQMEQAFQMDAVLDLRDEKATLAVGGGAPFAVFDRLQTFGRRWNAGARDARPWVRVDIADIAEGDELDPTSDIPTFATVAVNPVVLLDLIAGPLAGSVERVGTDEVAGVETTHYKANFDIDKVLRDTRRSRYPEDRREAIEDLLDVFAVSGRIHPGEVWLDADGLPRRFRLRLEEEPISRMVIEHVITIEIAEYGSDDGVTVPSVQELVDISSVVQMIRATVPLPATPEFATFLGIVPAVPAAPAATTTTPAPEPAP